jgi:hypothetical protein
MLKASVFAKWPKAEKNQNLMLLFPGSLGCKMISIDSLLPVLICSMN